MIKKMFFTCIAAFSIQAGANNVVITSVSTSGQDITAGANNAANFTNIEFDVNWDNSWRISGGANNWDAIWVFAKYKIETGGACTAGSTWSHCTLSTTDAHHTVTTANGVAATADVSSDGKGVFLYRTSAGNGSINWDDVKLRWRYRTDGLFDDCKVTVQVFAIEMVYVPAGDFILGDGSTTTIGTFRTPNVASSTFTVTSDNAITVGGGGAGSLGKSAVAQTGGSDDWTDAAVPVSAPTTVPAAFPVGYSAFYCMKYEISQQQYVEFLNTLDGTQQANRIVAVTAGSYMCNTAATGTPQNRNGVKCKNAPSGATAGEYACDLDDDDSYNETASDGLALACNWMTVADLAAYLDWAALRPMTETEYEKACRGGQGAGLPNPAVAGEYPWGTAANITAATTAGITNGGNVTETNSVANANICYAGSTTGPVRCGAFAGAATTRITSGATYYGIMEMSGNVWECCVIIGCAAGRSFQGDHGNGAVNSLGHADVNYWPGLNGNNTLTTQNTTYTTGVTGRAGWGWRGAAYLNANWVRIGDRDYCGQGWANQATTRDNRQGGRGVRTE
ncbi:MAG: SUMF1/EgtB/PvdO family nonheme iron enzyme [Bacteroidetes bacterium]|nr:SUMF1/EgtB/PvdO family nonheme iron enzyme [Bacteroidota bacterium]